MRAVAQLSSSAAIGAGSVSSIGQSFDDEIDAEFIEAVQGDCSTSEILTASQCQATLSECQSNARQSNQNEDEDNVAADCECLAASATCLAAIGCSAADALLTAVQFQCTPPSLVGGERMERCEENCGVAPADGPCGRERLLKRQECLVSAQLSDCTDVSAFDNESGDQSSNCKCLAAQLTCVAQSGCSPFAAPGIIALNRQCETSMCEEQCGVDVDTLQAQAGAQQLLIHVLIVLSMVTIAFF